jgi:hypothetical protein
VDEDHLRVAAFCHAIPLPLAKRAGVHTWHETELDFVHLNFLRVVFDSGNM